MPAVDTEQDVDLEALFDQEVPCNAILWMQSRKTGRLQPVEEPCPMPAKWLAVKSCGHKKTACDAHAVAWQMWDEEFLCVDCHEWVSAKFYPL